jgi:hypothetical protein
MCGNNLRQVHFYVSLICVVAAVSCKIAKKEVMYVCAVAGLLQLSSLALLQQGKLGAASAQLCAWLQHGGQGTEEACTSVRSFLAALHSQPHTAGTSGGGTADGSVSGTIGAGASSNRDRAAQGAGGMAAAAVKCVSAEERAAAVQQVAAAAAEHCRSDPAVALEVVMQLLMEQVSWYCAGNGSMNLPRPAA